MTEEEIIKLLTKHSVLIEEIRKDVKDIKDNHLKHVYKKLESQDRWLIGLLTAVILTLIATIINLVVK